MSQTASVQPFFAGLTIVTDRPSDTDHPTPSVAIGRIYVVPRCGLKIQLNNLSSWTKLRIKNRLKYGVDLLKRESLMLASEGPCVIKFTQ